MCDAMKSENAMRHCAHRPRETRGRYKRFRLAIKSCARRLRRPHDKWELGIVVSTVAAWIGALVVTGVVVRSLYLMYIKPDTT